MALEAVHQEIRTPCSPDELTRNIRHALSLGLPEADKGPLKTLHVVASGPSALLFDFSRAVLRHHEEPIDTLATNGALRLFTERGIAPTYWAACDPQALVADFLKDPPFGTTYLVASKCAPVVFQALEGRDVRLWHIDDAQATKGLRRVPVASSVTLCALSLMHRAFGYRHFEIWGWDACFVGGKDHALEQAYEIDPDHVHTLLVGADAVRDEAGAVVDMTGGRPFQTTRAWSAEVADAMVQLHYADYSVTIHGDGMVKAAREVRP